jgi:hypothetical protein
VKPCGLSRQFSWQRIEVNRIGGLAVKAAMRPAAVVGPGVTGDAGFGIKHAIVGVQINFLILDGFSQSLNEHIVAPAAETVHADMRARSSIPINDDLVNWLPWLAFMSSGAPVAQSSTAVKYTKPRTIGM